MPNHAYGFKPGLPDRRDRKFGLPLPLKDLPRKFDLRPSCPPVFDQLNENSCVANEVVNAIHFDRMKQGLPWQDLSRRFVYWNARRIEVTTESDSGCQIRDAIKTCAQTGVCPEKYCPYDDALVFEEPSIEAYNNAEEKLLTYDRLDDPKLSFNAQTALYKACLAQGTPFPIGIAIYQSFESDNVMSNGIVPYPSDDEIAAGVEGWHAVMFCGYDDDDDGGRFIVMNSWGKKWGQDGFFTIPYRYMVPDFSLDAWVIRNVS